MELDNRLSAQDFFPQNLALGLKSPLEKRKSLKTIFLLFPRAQLEGSRYFLFGMPCGKDLRNFLPHRPAQSGQEVTASWTLSPEHLRPTGWAPIPPPKANP